MRKPYHTSDRFSSQGNIKSAQIMRLIYHFSKEIVNLRQIFVGEIKRRVALNIYALRRSHSLLSVLALASHSCFPFWYFRPLSLNLLSLAVVLI